METVSAVKKYIDSEIAKNETRSKARNDKFITTLLENEGNFGRCKKEGSGRKTILRFLNGGSKTGLWKQWMIQDALFLFPPGRHAF